MSAVALQRKGWLGRADLFLVVAIAAWWVWVLISASWSGRTFTEASAYLIPSAILLLGVALGRVLGGLGRRWLVPELVALAAVVGLLVPMYANAQGALGVQLVALASLILLTLLPGLTSDAQANWTMAVVTAIVVLGALLAARSDAAAVLVVPMAVGGVLVIGLRLTPRKRRITGVAAVILVWSALMVIWLGSLKQWPEWLSANTALSKARHTLWGDALALWRKHPITGGGPGSFTESSELASSRPDLALVHSSVLQAGSELGLIGILLFAAVVAGGLAVAVHGSRPAGLIAVAAWTCLGVHSLIDHLWEFPAVVATAGVVIGWARSTHGEDS